jgi:hypothetical protein
MPFGFGAHSHIDHTIGHGTNPISHDHHTIGDTGDHGIHGSQLHSHSHQNQPQPNLGSHSGSNLHSTHPPVQFTFEGNLNIGSGHGKIGACAGWKW